jgi:hypothetical protein
MLANRSNGSLLSGADDEIRHGTSAQSCRALKQRLLMLCNSRSKPGRLLGGPTGALPDACSHPTLLMEKYGFLAVYVKLTHNDRESALSGKRTRKLARGWVSAEPI